MANWTNDDVEFLKNALRDGASAEEIAQELDRSKASVTAKINSMKSRGEFDLEAEKQAQETENTSETADDVVASTVNTVKNIFDTIRNSETYKNASKTIASSVKGASDTISSFTKEACEEAATKAKEAHEKAAAQCEETKARYEEAAAKAEKARAEATKAERELNVEKNKEAWNTFKKDMIADTTAFGSSLKDAFSNVHATKILKGVGAGVALGISSVIKACGEVAETTRTDVPSNDNDDEE